MKVSTRFCPSSQCVSQLPLNVNSDCFVKQNIQCLESFEFLALVAWGQGEFQLVGYLETEQF